MTKSEKIQHLYQTILNLGSEEACAAFFEDLCTAKELEEMSHRISAARLLYENRVYTEVKDKTGLSTATISRVAKCLNYGAGGYRMVIDRMKEHGTKIFTRMDTNGTGSLILGRDIAPEFAGRFDMVSISLNTDTAEKYDALCHPVQKGAYEAMKAFAKEIQKYVPTVMMTVVDTIPQEEIEACRRICEDEIGAIYRVREYIED